MLHWIENEDSFWNILILMSSEPIWKDGIWRFRLMSHELCDLDALILEGTLKVIKLELSLYSDDDSVLLLPARWLNETLKLTSS